MTAKRVFEGLTVVTIGLILLANTTGALPWSVWWNVLTLWPLLLVSAGIDILGRAVNSTALRVLSNLVIIGGLVFAALATVGAISVPGYTSPTTAVAEFSESRPVTADGSGVAEIDVGAARMSLEAGDELVTAEGRTPFGEPSVETASREGVAVVKVGLSEGGWRFPVPRADSFLDVALARELPWERVKVNGGMADLDLDLSDLDVERLDVNVGMSSLTVTFGDERPEAVAEIAGGMSSFRLRVPESLGVELRADNGLGSVNVPDGWTRVGGDGPFQGTWRSDGYDQAPAKLRLIVKTGLANVDVERY